MNVTAWLRIRVDACKPQYAALLTPYLMRLTALLFLLVLMIPATVIKRRSG
jgi:hypothetical protein